MQFSIESIPPVKKSPFVPPLSDSNINYVISAEEKRKLEGRESPKNTCEPMTKNDPCLYLQYETCYNLASEVCGAIFLSAVVSEKIQYMPNPGSRRLSRELDQLSTSI